MHRQTIRYRTQAGVALWSGSARIFSSSRIDWPGLGSPLYRPEKQIERHDPTPAKQPGIASGRKGLLRISGFGRGVDARSVRRTTESRMITRSPNKAMVPTPVSVTIPAQAGIAPATSAAHLAR